MMCLNRPLAFYFARLTLYELVFGTDVPRCHTASKNAAAGGTLKMQGACHQACRRLSSGRFYGSKKAAFKGLPGAADFG
jgi:hypothetical protein